MSLFSDPYFVLEIPTIKDVSATFKYYYFTKNESLLNANVDTIGSLTRSRYGQPRKVILELSDSISDLSTSVNEISEILAYKIVNATNLQKAITESTAQGQNASRLTFGSQKQLLKALYAAHPNFDATHDNYEALQKLLGNLDESTKELIAKVIEKSIYDGPIEFDPTSNAPIISTDTVFAESKSSATIKDATIGDLVSSIVEDSLSPFVEDFYQHEQKSFSLQSESRRDFIPGLVQIAEYFMHAEEILLVSAGEDLTSQLSAVMKKGAQVIGFIIYKTRIEGNERIPEPPILVFGKNKKNIEDASVMYGATYEYSIHTLMLTAYKNVQNGSGAGSKYYLMLSNDAKKIKIACEETTPPSTVTDINFYFMGSSMMLRWGLPIETNEQLIPINDIKYVQIFRRQSIFQPFVLQKVYDFNDAAVIYATPEFIPPTIVKKTHRGDTRCEFPLPEKGEIQIYAIATVDAHGNSSNLSSQFAVTLDDLAQPKISHVAFPGAPKQYPNMTLVDNVFKDVVKASGYDKLSIYHNPKFTILLNGNNEQNLITDAVDQNIPGYTMQIIDTGTQKDERIDIFVEQKK